MAQKLGGSRSPSKKPRASPPRKSRAGPPRSGRRFNIVWPRSATFSVVRLGSLIAGLIIIADLSTKVFTQRTFSADEAAALAQIDNLVNIVLFSLLGVLVVRQTGLMLSGVVAGAFASLLDAIVVAAASLMAPPPTPPAEVQAQFLENLVVGTLFAGLAGVLYAIVQRSSGRRPR